MTDLKRPWTFIRTHCGSIAVIFVVVVIFAIAVTFILQLDEDDTQIALFALLVATLSLGAALCSLYLTRHSVESTIRPWLSYTGTTRATPEIPIEHAFKVTLTNTGSVPTGVVNYSAFLCNKSDNTRLEDPRLEGQHPAIPPNGKLEITLWPKHDVRCLISQRSIILSLHANYSSPPSKQHETCLSFHLIPQTIPGSARKDHPTLVFVPIQPTYYT